MTKQTIEISYTQDGIFGPNEENIEGVDIPASFTKYEEMLTAELQKFFPNAYIEIGNGIEDKHSFDPDDMESPDCTIEVGEIIQRVWELWDWVQIETEVVPA